MDELQHESKNMDENCCVPDCRKDTVTNENTVSFHFFPKDDQMLEKWLLKINHSIEPDIRVTTHTKICSKHFNDEDLIVTKTGRRLLRHCAIPSTFPWTPESTINDHWRCCVISCKAPKYLPDQDTVSFHSFPKDGQMLQKWLVNINQNNYPDIQVTKKSRICSRHFNEDDLIVARKDFCFLRPSAIPSKFPWSKTISYHSSDLGLPDRLSLPKENHCVYVRKMDNYCNATCCVPYCARTHGYGYRFEGDKVSYHSLPKDEKLLKAWRVQIQDNSGPDIKVTKTSKICSRHFNKRDLLVSIKSGRRILRSNAVPSKFAWTKGATCCTPQTDENVSKIRHENIKKEKEDKNKTSCCVPLCTQSTYEVIQGVKITFHMLPKDKAKLKIWLVKMKVDREPHFKVTRQTRICSMHFNEEDFYLTKTGCRCLRSAAIPNNFAWTGDSLETGRFKIV